MQPLVETGAKRPPLGTGAAGQEVRPVFASRSVARTLQKGRMEPVLFDLKRAVTRTLQARFTPDAPFRWTSEEDLVVLFAGVCELCGIQPEATSARFRAALGAALFVPSELWPGPDQPSQPASRWQAWEATLQTLERLIHAHPVRQAGPLSSAVQIALAYLNGWGRALSDFAALGWDGRPQTARDALRFLVQREVGRGLDWLENKEEPAHRPAAGKNLGGSPSPAGAGGPAKDVGPAQPGRAAPRAGLRDPQYSPYHPRVPGWPEGQCRTESTVSVLHRIIASAEFSACACWEKIPHAANRERRQAFCRAYHALAGWRPEELDLPAFLRKAVLGTTGEVKGSGLASGLLVACLPDTLPLAVHDVAVWDCACGNRGIYLPTCSECGQKFQRAIHAVRGEARLLLEGPGMGFAPVWMWECSPLLTEYDFRDFTRLVQQLQETAHPGSAAVGNRLSARTRELIADPTAALSSRRSALARELNRQLQLPSLLGEAGAANDLREATRAPLAQEPAGEARVRRNRQLLEEILDGHIRTGCPSEAFFPATLRAGKPDRTAMDPCPRCGRVHGRAARRLYVWSPVQAAGQQVASGDHAVLPSGPGLDRPFAEALAEVLRQTACASWVIDLLLAAYAADDDYALLGKVLSLDPDLRRQAFHLLVSRIDAPLGAEALFQHWNQNLPQRSPGAPPLALFEIIREIIQEAIEPPQSGSENTRTDELNDQDTNPR